MIKFHNSRKVIWSELSLNQEVSIDITEVIRICNFLSVGQFFINFKIWGCIEFIEINSDQSK